MSLFSLAVQSVFLISSAIGRKSCRRLEEETHSEATGNIGQPLCDDQNICVPNLEFSPLAVHIVQTGSGATFIYSSIEDSEREPG
jgi:hypothetical protein